MPKALIPTSNVKPHGSTNTYQKGFLFWHRRDLRLDDNQGLYQAAQRAPVQSVFIFDTTILNTLGSHDRRVDFIHQSVQALADEYQKRGSCLWVLYGDPSVLIPKLCSEYGFMGVVANKDYEYTAQQRDQSVYQQLHQMGKKFICVKDHVIYEDSQVRTLSGSPFMVFTPFKQRWLEHYLANPVPSVPAPNALFTVNPDNPLDTLNPYPLMPLTDMGFFSTDLAALNVTPGTIGAQNTLDAFFSHPIDAYDTQRDYPAVPGASRLGVHLRFGTLSIRQAAYRAYLQTQQAATQGAHTWLSELIWRDFYSALLSRNPKQALGECFNPVYNDFTWNTDPTAFYVWCQGQTGYPIVDAGIQELIQTGYMHNRVRMIVASFLCKHLLINWQKGEAFFAQHLLDFDQASNIGGWQWSASTGCDAQPYFRIFNPTSQSERFDPQGTYIKKWLPALQTLETKYVHAPWLMSISEQQSAGVLLGIHYPRPIVNHALARQRALSAFEQHTKLKKEKGL